MTDGAWLREHHAGKASGPSGNSTEPRETLTVAVEALTVSRETPVLARETPPPPRETHPTRRNTVSRRRHDHRWRAQLQRAIPWQRIRLLVMDYRIGERDGAFARSIRR